MRIRYISYDKNNTSLKWYEKLLGFQIIRNPVIASYEVRYCEFHIGLNCTYQFLTKPKTLKILIPFLKKDVYFLRYKTIIPDKHFNIIEKRINDRIEYIKNDIERNGDKFGLLTTVIEILDEMKTGQLKSYNISSIHPQA